MMRYFTPDLLIRSNSLDDAVSDAADDDWEMALGNYKARLTAIRDLLPPSVRRLTELCLHDAELLAEGELVGLSVRHAEPLARVAAFSVKLDDVVTSIFYGLSGEVRTSAGRDERPFSSRRRPLSSHRLDWLYEEIDTSATAEPGFVHRVLLNDGRELEIPFTSVAIHQVVLPPALSLDGRRKQPA